MARGETATIAGIALSHPDRVVWPDIGLTKRDVAEHYVRVAPLLLPHVAGRPLTLVRCPRGLGGRCFVQRNVGPGFGAAVGRVSLRIAEKTATVPIVEDVAGLVSLVRRE